MTNNANRVLLVEDDDNHFEIFRFYARKSFPDIEILHMRDGKEVIDFIQLEPCPVDKLPGLILLDLNLPKFNGHEVLKAIKSHPLAKRIPVVILSSSDREEDVRLAYEYHANSYFRKPDKIGQFSATVDKVLNYWLNTIRDTSTYRK